MHYLVDGRFKYIWFSQTGRELLFDLDADPREMHDLTQDVGSEELLSPWRAALIDVLADRPERFTDGVSLTPGTSHTSLVPDGAGNRRWL